MGSLRRQRGEGKAGCVFWILIFLVGGIFGWQMIPAKIADMQLKDHMDELAKLRPRADGKAFQNSILKRAEELDIPLKAEDVKVDKNLRRVRMKVKYTRPISLLVTTYEWKFEHDIERDIFLM